MDTPREDRPAPPADTQTDEALLLMRILAEYDAQVAEPDPAPEHVPASTTTFAAVLAQVRAEAAAGTARPPRQQAPVLHTAPAYLLTHDVLRMPPPRLARLQDALHTLPLTEDTCARLRQCLEKLPRPARMLRATLPWQPRASGTPARPVTDKRAAAADARVFLQWKRTRQSVELAGEPAAPPPDTPERAAIRRHLLRLGVALPSADDDPVLDAAWDAYRRWRGRDMPLDAFA